MCGGKRTWAVLPSLDFPWEKVVSVDWGSIGILWGVKPQYEVEVGLFVKLVNFFQYSFFLLQLNKYWCIWNKINEDLNSYTDENRFYLSNTLVLKNVFIYYVAWSMTCDGKEGWWRKFFVGGIWWNVRICHKTISSIACTIPYFLLQYIFVVGCYKKP